MKIQNLRALFKKITKTINHLELQSSEFSQNQAILEKKIKNPFLVVNNFKYPLRDEYISEKGLLSGEKTFNDFEISSMRTIFEKSGIADTYELLKPTSKSLQIGIVESIQQKELLKMSEELNFQYNIEEEMDENDEIQQRLNELIMFDKKIMFSLNSIDEYIDETKEYYVKPYENIYLAKNLRFYKPPYFVMSDGKNLFFIPFIEGIKIVDSLERSNIIAKKLMVFDTLGNNYYAKGDVTQKDISDISTEIRFVIKKISYGSYISVKDLINLLYINRDVRLIINKIIGDISSVEQLVGKYNKCLVNYDKQSTEILKLIEVFNEMHAKLGAENCGKVVTNILQSIDDKELLETFECIINLLTYNKKI
jgi:hypothetical protein